MPGLCDDTNPDAFSLMACTGGNSSYSSITTVGTLSNLYLFADTSDTLEIEEGTSMSAWNTTVDDNNARTNKLFIKDTDTINTLIGNYKTATFYMEDYSSYRTNDAGSSDGYVTWKAIKLASDDDLYIRHEYCVYRATSDDPYSYTVDGDDAKCAALSYKYLELTQ
ncbi:hypothetical protein [Treponema sp.]|uniref:hypothetical protein n=1 Tax=Treponema sp. TaxID=166 RepID=UPI0025CFB759|nr:hypothetical protein [Treponema sp.]MCR5218488.1 hypothetical protein [Treponema sp.]